MIINNNNCIDCEEDRQDHNNRKGRSCDFRQFCTFRDSIAQLLTDTLTASEALCVDQNPLTFCKLLWSQIPQTHELNDWAKHNKHFVHEHMGSSIAQIICRGVLIRSPKILLPLHDHCNQCTMHNAVLVPLHHKLHWNHFSARCNNMRLPCNTT